MTYIMCYVNKKGEMDFTRFEPQYGDPALILDEWRQNNPDGHVIYMFPETADQSDVQDKARKFYDNAPACEMMPLHYGRIFKQGNEVLRISGINIRKRKYKIELTDIHTGHVYKCTPDFAKTMLAKHPWVQGVDG